VQARPGILEVYVPFRNGLGSYSKGGEEHDKYPSAYLETGLRGKSLRGPIGDVGSGEVKGERSSRAQE
jgi:hypothetical protein